MLTPAQLQAAAIPFGCVFNGRAAVLYLLARLSGVTDPATIQANSAGFNLPVSDELLALALLAQMAGVDIAEIISGSEAFKSLDRASAIYLAEVIASNGLNPPASETGIQWGPDVAFLDGGTNGVDAPQIIFYPTATGGGMAWDSLSFLESFSAPNLVSVGLNFTMSTMPNLIELDLPVLQSVGGAVAINSNTLLPAVSLPALTTISAGGGLSVAGCSALLSLDAPLLVPFSGELFCSENPLLETVNLPVWSPANGTNVSFSNCSLSVASVNHILARCVANPAYASGIVDLAGGASAAPAGQGAADVITLTGRGVTVNTN